MTTKRPNKLVQLIEELERKEKEAQEAKAKLTEEETQRQRKEEYRQKCYLKFEKPLTFLKETFCEFAEVLNKLNNLGRDYAVVEYDLVDGNISGQISNFRVVDSEDSSRPYDFSFVYDCVPQNTGKELVWKRFTDLRPWADLRSRQLWEKFFENAEIKYRLVEEEIRTGAPFPKVKMYFSVCPQIKIRLDFKGNPDSLFIDVTRVNPYFRKKSITTDIAYCLGKLGRENRRISPGQINDDSKFINLIEAIMKLVLGEHSNFLGLTEQPPTNLGPDDAEQIVCRIKELMRYKRKKPISIVEILMKVIAEIKNGYNTTCPPTKTSDRDFDDYDSWLKKTEECLKKEERRASSRLFSIF